MSDRPLTKPAHSEPENQPSAREESSGKRPVPFPSDASRWLTYAALVIAVIAAVLAGLAYFHPKHTASVPQQGGDAKANVCAAYAAARKAVVINTHLESQNPDLQLAIAANARLALIGSGSYLRDRLAANTAAPSDLANAANSLADTVEQLGINYLIQAPPAVQDPVRNNLNNELAQLDKMCA